MADVVGGITELRCAGSVVALAARLLRPVLRRTHDALRRSLAAFTGAWHRLHARHSGPSRLRLARLCGPRRRLRAPRHQITREKTRFWRGRQLDAERNAGSFLTAGWLGLRVWRQTGPLARDRSSTSYCRLDGGGSCSTFCGGSDWPRSCFIQRGAFAAASPPPASPCGDTDGTKSRSAEAHPRALPARFGSLAQGPAVAPRVARRGGYDGEVIPRQDRLRRR
jgi:hypothetical protein